MRIALFGGSFDPPHLGHLRIALTAAKRLHLDQVLLAPVGHQPLKSQEAAPFTDRLAMVELLTAFYPHLAASSIDAPRDNRPNYTVDTLARLRPTLPADTELFFLAGTDSFLTLPHWHRPEALLETSASGGLLSGWILAARPGFPLAALAEALPPGYALGAPVESAGPVLTQYVITPEGNPGIPLHLLPDLDDPSTATRIREVLAHEAEAPYLLPAVRQYIRDHGLYRVLR